jgi:hypothetical protein
LCLPQVFSSQQMAPGYDGENAKPLIKAGEREMQFLPQPRDGGTLHDPAAGSTSRNTIMPKNLSAFLMLECWQRDDEAARASCRA